MRSNAYAKVVRVPSVLLNRESRQEIQHAIQGCFNFVEHEHKAVSLRFDLATTVSDDNLSHLPIVPTDQFQPLFITDPNHVVSG